MPQRPLGAARARGPPAAMLQVRRTASRVTSFKKVRLPGMPGGRVACADMGSPLDACHEELSAAPPLYATLIHTAVRMDVDVATRERLARGCLGKIVKGEGGDASAPAVGGGSAGGAVALPAAVVPTEPLQLSPEETFFMAHNLQCLRVTRLGDAAPMSSAELWRELVRLVPRFAYTYTAFVHFRAAGWMARPGLQFGADMVLYRRHPEYVHSDYAAIVLPPGKHEVPFLEMQAIGRMCEQVNKVRAGPRSGALPPIPPLLACARARARARADACTAVRLRANALRRV